MAVPNYSTGDPLLDFFFTLFNGIAEVPLFSSPITGILILAGVILASRKAGAMMVLSGLVGAGMAIALGAPYGLVTFGLFGYNSILTGMAFWSGPFVKANKATFFISVFGAAITAVTWMALSHLMGDLFILDGVAKSWAIPGFTSSFIFTTWAMMYASKRYGHDIWPEPPAPAKEELIASKRQSSAGEDGEFQMDCERIHDCNSKGCFTGNICRELENRGILGSWTYSGLRTCPSSCRTK